MIQSVGEPIMEDRFPEFTVGVTMASRRVMVSGTELKMSGRNLISFDEPWFLYETVLIFRI